MLCEPSRECALCLKQAQASAAVWDPVGAALASCCMAMTGLHCSLQVLYNFFEWPTLPGARLAVIGVANTFDMPERVLPKIASRLGSARVPFQPYTKAQLVTIISARLTDANASSTFEPNAIDFASRKVSRQLMAPDGCIARICTAAAGDHVGRQYACACIDFPARTLHSWSLYPHGYRDHHAGQVAGVTGDLRRALELCRKAAEVAQREGVPSVRLAHIDAAVKVMFGAAHMRLLRASCPLDKVLLAALLLDTKATGGMNSQQSML